MARYNAQWGQTFLMSFSNSTLYYNSKKNYFIGPKLKFWKKYHEIIDVESYQMRLQNKFKPVAYVTM